ncbi:MAG: glutamate--tRNA ligase [Syntrophaceae bacterium]|nr:glutamate--tRNA ligase [Syntrophaceae bacterium]
MSPEGPRVRFAPSPTGDLHVGGARTALFNWLFARQHHGTLILRLEDTDALRSTEEFERNLLEDLDWLSLSWDEGPGVGGPFGPYRQSERLPLYRSVLDRLLEEGCVYPCYCTDEELEAERASLLARGRPPRYGGRCRDLSDEERRRMEDGGRHPAYRFRVPPGEIVFEDLIRGTMRFHAGDLGDFIIVRSNGLPAYQFAVVIDDHAMQVSHVIRGEDHLSNTALQLCLYEALGYPPPVFAHHGLVLGEDRAKLSKRHGSTSVRQFREQGFLPEAFVNYMALLGHTPEGGKDILNRGELTAAFSLTRAGKGGAVFDGAKLRWLNGQYLRHCDAEVLEERLRPLLEKAGYPPDRMPDRKTLSDILEILRDNMVVLEDAIPYLPAFLDADPPRSAEADALLLTPDGRIVLDALREGLREAAGADPWYGPLIHRIQDRTGFRGRRLLLPVRAALTGLLKGPELEKIFAWLGREAALKRVDRLRIP